MPSIRTPFALTGALTGAITGAAAGALLLACGAAHAAEFNALQLLSQAEFRALSEDVAAAISYKPMIPSEGLGITGFDLGLSAGATSVAHRDVLRKAAGGASVPKSLPWVGVRAVKGLPFDIDIGVVAISLPGTNVRATGGELRWAFIAGNMLLPAVAVRVATMNLSGVDQLKVRANSVDLSLSKGFIFLTPYAGVGYVDVRTSAPRTPLRKENFGLNKVFAGVNIAFTPLALVIEADRTGKASSVGAKVAIRW